MKKAIALLLAAVLLLAVCAACGDSGGSGAGGSAAPDGSAAPGGDTPSDSSPAGGTNTPAPSGKDTLTVAFKADPPNLDPHNNAIWTSFIVEEVIFDRLVQKDENGEIQPMLAERWEVIDDTTVRFFLRQDVTFHNGDKFTAEDVRYTIERATVMKGSVSMMAAFDGPGTAVVDEYTVDIKLKNAFGPIFNYLASSRGNIVSAKHLEEVGEEAHGRSPVGTGPFKFSSWDSGDKITLVRNDEYWGGPAKFQNLIFRVVDESSSRAIEVESGAVDVAFHIDEADIARLEASPDVNLISAPGYTTHELNLNIWKNEFLQDVRVRKALYIGIDKAALVHAVYGDTAVPSTSSFSKNVIYWTQADKNEYDPELAKQLLTEAGFDFENQTIVIDVNNDTTMNKVGEVVQNMWTQLGIKTEIRRSDAAGFSDITNRSDFMVTVFDNPAVSGDPDQALFDWKTNKHGIILDDQYEPISPEAKEVWDLIVSARSSYDPEVRAAEYAKLQDLMCNEYYGMLMIADVNSVYAIGNDVKGFYPSPAYMPNLSWCYFE